MERAKCGMSLGARPLLKSRVAGDYQVAADRGFLPRPVRGGLAICGRPAVYSQCVHPLFAGDTGCPVWWAGLKDGTHLAF